MKKINPLLIVLAAVAFSMAFTKEAYSQDICHTFLQCSTDAECQDFSNAGILP